MLPKEIKEAITRVATADNKGEQALRAEAIAQENLQEATEDVVTSRAECDAALTDLANLLATKAKPPIVQG